MADEPQKSPGNPIPTEGFPTIYANLASVTANFNDIRIYFADAQPKTIVTAPVAVSTTAADANVAARICMIMAPEFAKNLHDVLSSTIALYEKQFGPLRPTPQVAAQRLADK